MVVLRHRLSGWNRGARRPCDIAATFSFEQDRFQSFCQICLNVTRDIPLFPIFRVAQFKGTKWDCLLGSDGCLMMNPRPVPKYVRLERNLLPLARCFPFDFPVPNGCCLKGGTKKRKKAATLAVLLSRSHFAAGRTFIGALVKQRGNSWARRVAQTCSSSRAILLHILLRLRRGGPLRWT